ncbi:MFS transporter [Microbulbifer sp. OS29]|uniref:MFS transporter n=1 Tax=Microbulbifer okhotskensis TaxID=2926617 RepID=A0A9X2EPE1_9GAMM|nr:MFS transporter [Microbulbifer okhotskensis]MCO1335957.1 MFS transporter [Microbulbifer okhotskensis]
MTGKNTSLTKTQILGLFALSLAIFLIGNDLTAFSVALPAIEKQFNSNITTTQWIINGYTLAFGILLISGGRLADIFGRRRIFFIGMAAFVFFSLLGGLATDIPILLVARGLMGIGSALMWPAILGMTYGMMPEGRSGLAGGLVMAMCAAANAIGPVLGGILTDWLSWRWIFFINLPVAALAYFVCWKFIPDDSPENVEERIDFGGVISLTTSLFCLLLALDLVVDVGFKSPIIIMLALMALLFMGLFILAERYAGKNALIPLDMAANHGFFAAGFATLLLSVVFFAALLYVPQYLTKMHHQSAMYSGMGLLPMMISFGLTSFIAGGLYETLGAKAIVSVGTVAMCVGMFMLSHLHKETTFVEMVPGLIVLGAGIGLFYSAITTAAITVVAPERASLAGAILYMFQIGGGAIGLGVNTTIVALAPDMSMGIDRAFTVNAYLALVGLVVCLLFVSGKPAAQASVAKN